MAKSVNLNRVRELREASGLSQVALAEAVQLTRQSIGAIEAGRAMPAVDVALRIARALECQVEDLFSQQSEVTIVAESTAAKTRGRVALAHIRGRWVCYPLAADGLRHSADGLVAKAGHKRVDVQPLKTLAEARENLTLLGCAAGLGLLADRLNSRPGPGRFVWLGCSSAAALESLAQHHTQVAGVHLVDIHTGEANVADVRRAGFNEAIALITLGRWEMGLVRRHSDVNRIRSGADLALPGLRIVAREQGAGAQRLLEREVRGAGQSIALVRKTHLLVRSHLDVARAVALGAADIGVATRDAALACGLDFVPLTEERYDLAVPTASLQDPRLERLFDVLVSGSFRRELSALGYDVRCAGERIAEVQA
jgi:putative molybdopterin biosynthesis protein